MAKEERDSTISNLLKLPLNDRRGELFVYISFRADELEIAFNLLWSLPRHGTFPFIFSYRIGH